MLMGRAPVRIPGRMAVGVWIVMIDAMEVEHGEQYQHRQAQLASPDRPLRITR